MNAIGNAFEKIEPELVLEVFDRGAQRLLRHVQPLGRTRDVLFFRDRDKITQMRWL